MSKVSKSALFLAASISVLTCNTAFGQQAPADTATGATAPDAMEGGIETVVVTAQRRTQSANDVGETISVISGDLLVDRGAFSPNDLAKFVPGLSVASSQRVAPVYTLRGVGYNDTSLAATPTVAVYVDEVPLPYPAMTEGALLDLSRVEVDKGPQGTLFGMNSTAGAINYIANKPTDTVEAGLTGTLSRFDTYRLEGYVSGPVTDGLGIRLAVEHDHGDGWQISRTRPNGPYGRMGGPDHTTGRFIASWDATSDLNVVLNLNGWLDKSQPQAPQLIAIIPFVPANLVPEYGASALTPLNSRSADWDLIHNFYRNDKFGQASLRADWRLTPNFTLTGISSVDDFSEDTVIEGDGSAVYASIVPDHGHIKSYDEEVRLAADFGGLHAILGADYTDDHTSDYNLIDTTGYSNSQNVFGYRQTQVWNYTIHQISSEAIFANADYQFTDSLSAVAGIRYTASRNSFQGCTYDPNLPSSPDYLIFRTLSNVLFPGNPYLDEFQPGSCLTIGPEGAPYDGPNKLSETNVSWNTTLNYKFDQNMLLYVRIAKGYKAGSFPNSGASSYISYLPAKQESVLAYEAGVKATLLDSTLQVNAAGFYYDYTNKQLSGFLGDAVFGTLAANVNIPKSRVAGVEGEVTWAPGGGFVLNGSATYVDTTIKEYIGINNLGQVQNFAGGHFSFSPSWSLNGDATYERPLTSTIDWRISGNVSYRSRTKSVIGTTDPRYNIDPYALLDLQAGVAGADGTWSAMLWGRNVTNTYYWVNVQRTADGLSRYTGMPATYGITVNYKF